MKKLLPLLIAVLAVGAFGIWRLARDEDGRATVTSAPTATAKRQPAPAADVEGAAVAPERSSNLDAEGAAARRAVDPGDAADRYGSWSYERGDRRRVVVRGAADAPRDEDLEVLVFEGPLGLDELFGDDEDLPHGAATLYDRVRAGERTHGLVARVPVGEDGACEVAIPDELEVVHLTVLGRWLARLGTAPLERAAPPDVPFELETILGGVVRVALELPADRRALLEDAGAFAAELSNDFAAFSMGGDSAMDAFRAAALPDADGVLEFVALPSTRPYQVLVTHPEFAVAHARGLEVVPGAVLETTLALEPGARLAGVVVEPDGAPVPGADVQVSRQGLWGFPGETLVEVVTDGEGRFSLDDAPSGVVLVGAAKPGMLEAGGRTLELAAGDVREDLRFTLDPGDAIAGRVRTATGEPAAHASVEVTFDPAALAGAGAWNAARGASGEAQADADGAFRVTGLGKGPFLVVASWTPPAEGGPAGAERVAQRTDAAGVRPGTDDLELALAPMPLLEVRVVDGEGTPVPDYLLVSKFVLSTPFLPGPTESLRAEDAPDGLLRTRELFEGTWKLTVHAEGFGPGEEVEVALPREPGAAPVEIVLPREAVVAGRVLDPDGAPVVGAEVTVPLKGVELVARRSGDLVVPSTTSREDGAFELAGLGVGEVSLVAHHPGFADAEPVALELAEGARTDDVTLVLRVGATLTGEVYDRSGEPLANGTVYLQDMTTWDGSTVELDEEGRFEERALEPGPVQVTAMYGAVDPGAGDEAGNLQAIMENIRFAGADLVDGETTHVVIGAPPADPVVVAVEVVHADEAPPAGSIVTFLPQETTGWSAMKLQALDADGRCEVTLDEPGEYLVQFQASSNDLGSFTQNTLEFRRSVPRAERHVVRLDLPVGRVAGLVTGPDGEPAGGVRVSLAPSGGVRLGTFSGGQFAETTTADDGRFDFDFLKAGEYRVSAGGSLFGFDTANLLARQVQDGVRVEEGALTDGVRFRLERPATLTGFVRDGAGRPVDRAAIFVQDAEGRWIDAISMVSTGGDGRYEVTGLPPGQVTVFARTDGLASSGRTTRVQSGPGNELDLVVETGSELLVRALDGEGNDVEAVIRVEGPDGSTFHGLLSMTELMNFERSWSTREQRVGPLPAGRYTVLATLPDGRSAKKSVRLGDRPLRRLKLRLR